MRCGAGSTRSPRWGDSGTVGPGPLGEGAILAFTTTFLQTVTLVELDDLSVVALPSTVPEPAAWAVVGAGLAGVAGVVRRRAADP